VRGTRRELLRLGVDLTGARWYDGSGLSRENRLAPTTLVGVLQVAASAARPDLRAVVTGLPVAGFTGSLTYRFEDAAPAGRGRVRAKTGTLTGVSALAGIATDLDGHPLVFALVADRVRLPRTLEAREALDDAAATLGACRCGR
jgi:D-alanyl-D-alanine carboxypeptidase/D-alanyl-D-alanine-endopeptidase (penicillin-binding protein 4)